MRDVPFPRWLRTSITHVCPIPPKPRMRNLIHMSSFRSRITPFAIFLILFPIICIPLALTYIPVYPDGRRLPASLSTDFILIDRNPQLEPHLNRGFCLEAYEQLIIQDCIVYTVPYYAPQVLKDAYTQDVTKYIYVTDYANLTLRNVVFMPYANISLGKQASVALINCSNYGTSWSEKTYVARGRWQLLPYGTIAGSDDATLRLQNTSLKPYHYMIMRYVL
jgi:hypothetical protein